MTSIFGRAIIVPKTNKSGGALAKGDAVILDSANDNAVTTTTTAAYTGIVGVVVEENGIANNATGRVQFGGHVALVNVNASVTRGHYALTHTVAKQATDGGASRVTGAFGVFTTGGTTPEADLFVVPDGSGTAAAGTLTTVEELDGSPTDSAVTKLVMPSGTLGITSHVATYTPLLPWTIDVDVFQTPVTNTNWDTLTNDTACLHAFRKASTGAQNAEIGWDVLLAAGTWTVRLVHMQDTDRGIYTCAFDGSSVGTIDGYAASTTRNTRSAITGISVAATAKVRVTLKMATKNASSSSYFGVIHALRFERTA